MVHGSLYCSHLKCDKAVRYHPNMHRVAAPKDSLVLCQPCLHVIPHAWTGRPRKRTRTFRVESGVFQYIQKQFNPRLPRQLDFRYPCPVKLTNRAPPCDPRSRALRSAETLKSRRIHLEALIWTSRCCVSPLVSGRRVMRPPCKFFGTPRGCNKGDRCTFAHDGSAAPRQTDSTSRARGRGAGPPSGGRDVAYGGRGAAYGNDTFRDILTELGCRADPQPGLVQRWVQLALQRCERGSASQVLQQLRKDDGQNLLRAAALQISQAGVSLTVH